MKRIKSVHILIALYIVTLVVELFIYVPYNNIQILVSQQNVAHIEIIGNGYSTMKDIDDHSASIASKGKPSEGQVVNSQQLLLNVVLTTIVFSAIYFYFIFKRKTVDNEIAKELSLLKNQNQQLQNNINLLTVEKTNLLNDKKICNEILSEIKSMNRIVEFQNLPELDINDFAFADDETQKKAQKQYAQDVLKYIEYGMHNFLMSNYFENEIIESDYIATPYLDLDSLAFADEAEQIDAQEEYADNMYQYIKYRFKNDLYGDDMLAEEQLSLDILFDESKEQNN